MNKRAIAILGAIFILIVGTLGFLIYSKYGSKGASNNSPVTETTPLNNTDVQPTDQEYSNDQNPSGTDNTYVTAGTVIQLTTDQVVSPVLFYNGGGVTYFNRSGQLLRSDLEESNGQLLLTNQKILEVPQKPNISKILWPTQGNNYIAEIVSADGTKTWSFFDSDTVSYTDLSPKIYSLDWAMGGSKIVYIWLEGGKAYLTISNPDGSDWQTLAEMWDKDDIVKVSPDSSSILFYHGSSTEKTNAINLVSSDAKVWKELVKDGYNIGALWSPDSQKFLFNKLDNSGNKYQLWYYDLASGEAVNTGLFTTVDKAVWGADSDVFYAAEPVTGAAGSGALTIDKFYQVSLQDMSKQEYSTGNFNVDGRELFLSLDGTRLFFKNAQDGGLYYLDLNQQSPN